MNAFNFLMLAFLFFNAGLRLFFAFNFSAAAKAASIVIIAVSFFILLFPGHLKWLMLLFGFSFSFFGFQPYNIFSHIFELALTCVAIALTILNFRSAPQHLNRHILIFVLSYMILSVFSLQMLPVTLGEIRNILFHGLNSPQGIYMGSIMGVNRLILFSFFALQISFREDAGRLYYYIFLGLFISGVFAAFAGLVDFYGLISLSWYRQAVTPGVLHGFFLNRGWFAQYVMVVTPFIMMGFMSKNKTLLWKLFLFALLIICELALILSGARAGWVSYPLVLFFCWLFVHFLKGGENTLSQIRWRDAVKVIVYMPVTIVISLFIIFQVLPYFSRSVNSGTSQNDTKTDGGIVVVREQSVRIIDPSDRINVWRDGLNVGRENPLFGMGYDSFRWHAILLDKIADSYYKKGDAILSETPHNTFLQLFVSNGIAGLSIWLLITGYALMILVIDLVKNNNLLNIPVLISIIVAHIHGFFQDLQYIPMIWAIIFLEIGYVMTIREDVLQPPHRKKWDAVAAACIVIALLSSLVYYQKSSYDFLKTKYGIKIYRLE